MKLVLTGYTTTSNQGGKDVFLIKADANGDASFNSACFNITPFTAALQINNISFTQNNFNASFSDDVSNFQHAISPTPASGILEDNCSPLDARLEEKLEAGPENILDLYPNPFIDHVNISLPDLEKGSLRLVLTDELGRIVKESFYVLEGQNEIQWQLAGLASGLYVVQGILLQDGKIERFRRRIIKNY